MFLHDVTDGTPANDSRRATQPHKDEAGSEFLGGISDELPGPCADPILGSRSQFPSWIRVTL